MTTVYGGDCIRIGAGGVPEFVYLTVEDDDRNLENGEVGVTFAIDGVTLATAPDTFFGSADLTLLDGPFASSCITFVHDGDTYIFGLAVDVTRVAGVGTVTQDAAVGGTAYTSRGLVVGQEKVFIGDAVVVTRDSGGATLSSAVEEITVYDDDTRIQFNGANGAPNSEDGGTPVAFLGNSSSNEDFNQTDAGVGDTDLVLVEVQGLDGSGNVVTFEAIKYTIPVFLGPGNFGTKTYYIPRTGSVDPADVASVTSETVLATSLDGELYRDFGLGNTRTQVDGDSGDNLIEVGIGHDFLRGLGGADSLIGNIGEDRLDGGGGADLLFGGLHNDRLAGGRGADSLYGGVGNDDGDGGDAADEVYGGLGNDDVSGAAGDDTLDGGDGDDNLSGGADNDLVKGGAGNDVASGDGGDDTLRGGAGNDLLEGGTGSDSLDGGSGDDALTGGTLADTLNGGDGADAMTGEGGADVFILVADGDEDAITDYQDGTDLIDVDSNFAGLVITDIAAGIVQVEHNGDILIVEDGLGLLTAADLTNADFI